MSVEKLNIEELLGEEASYLLDHKCETVSKDVLSLPSPTFVDDVWSLSDIAVHDLSLIAKKLPAL